MIPLLTPLFQGEWAPLGEALACAPRWPPDAIQVSHLIRDDRLLASAIRQHARRRGVTGEDLRAAASAWSMDYLWALLPPVAAAASVLQHGFPMRADQVAVELDGTGTPTRFHIAREGSSMAGEPAAVRYGPLLWHHLEPLFAAIARQTHLPQKILWANAARYLQTILEQALALTGDAPHVAADQHALLHEPHWPDHQRNPLYARQREARRIEDGTPVTIRLHRQCCLYYRLPGHGYCGACPLDPQHRIHLRAGDDMLLETCDGDRDPGL